MVTGGTLPSISWEEDFGPADDGRVSELILATLTSRLRSPVGRTRLYFVLFTPTPYSDAEQRFLTAAGGDLRVLSLPHRGRCYAFRDTAAFRASLPLAFRLGPPEITLVGANCGFDLGAPEDEITRLVLTALGQPPAETMGDLAGLHFDSGDLVEAF